MVLFLTPFSFLWRVPVSSALMMRWPSAKDEWWRGPLVGNNFTVGLGLAGAVLALPVALFLAATRWGGPAARSLTTDTTLKHPATS
jgi:hypothetical protein